MPMVDGYSPIEFDPITEIPEDLSPDFVFNMVSSSIEEEIIEIPGFEDDVLGVSMGRVDVFYRTVCGYWERADTGVLEDSQSNQRVSSRVTVGSLLEYAPFQDVLVISRIKSTMLSDTRDEKTVVTLYHVIQKGLDFLESPVILGMLGKYKIRINGMDHVRELIGVESPLTPHEVLTLRRAMEKRGISLD